MKCTKCSHYPYCAEMLGIDYASDECQRPVLRIYHIFREWAQRTRSIFNYREIPVGRVAGGKYHF